MFEMIRVLGKAAGLLLRSQTGNFTAVLTQAIGILELLRVAQGQRICVRPEEAQLYGHCHL